MSMSKAIFGEKTHIISWLLQTWLWLIKINFHNCQCNSGDLPSPSSTTAWITMGNTPLSRSKFSFKGKKIYILSFNKTCLKSTRTCIHVYNKFKGVYIFLFPFAEIYFERWHRELLANTPFVMHSFRHHWRILRAVPAHSMSQRKTFRVQNDEKSHEQAKSDTPMHLFFSDHTTTKICQTSIINSVFSGPGESKDKQNWTE